MMAFQQSLLAFNVLLALVFTVCYFVVKSKRSQPRTKARVGWWLCILFFAFLSLLLLFAVLGAVFNRNALYLALSVYVAIPFVIGRLVSYRTLGFYAALQFLVFLASAVTLCLI